MKTGLLFACLWLSFAMVAQSPADDFYYDHKDRKNSVSINIGNFLLTAGSWFIEEDGIKQLMKKSRRAKILLSEENNFVNQKEVNRLVRDLHRDHFESLAHIRTEGTEFDIYVKEDEHGYIRNILLLLNESDEFAMVSLECKFRMDDVQCLLEEL